MRIYSSRIKTLADISFDERPAGPSLRVVSTFSVGYDHVTVKALQQAHVRLGYTPDVLNNAGKFVSSHILANSLLTLLATVVADLTVMLTLMTMRRIKQGMDVVSTGSWPQTHWSPLLLTGPSLTRPNLTIGFLGFGRISHAVLDRLLAFTLPKNHDAPPVVIYNTSKERDDQAEIDREYSHRFGVRVARAEKDDLASQSDILIVLCTLNDQTRGLVGTEFLSKMRPSSVLINAARVSGQVILPYPST